MSDVQLKLKEEGKVATKDAPADYVFSTNEQAVADGQMVLDDKGRQPGIYLEDVEEAARLAHEKAMNEALGNAKVAVNSNVDRQVNVTNSPLPPVTVATRQETPAEAAPKA